MIFPLIGIVVGAALGLVSARRRGGKPADLAQWAAVGAMIGGVIGLFVLVFVERSLV